MIDDIFSNDILLKSSSRKSKSLVIIFVAGFGLAAAAAGVRAGYPTVLPAHYG